MPSFNVFPRFESMSFVVNILACKLKIVNNRNWKRHNKMVDRIRYPTVSCLPFYYVFFQFLLLTIFNLQANILTTKDILSNLVFFQVMLNLHCSHRRWFRPNLFDNPEAAGQNQSCRSPSCLSSTCVVESLWCLPILELAYPVTQEPFMGHLAARRGIYNRISQEY